MDELGSLLAALSPVAPAPAVPAATVPAAPPPVPQPTLTPSAQVPTSTVTPAVPTSTTTAAATPIPSIPSAAISDEGNKENNVSEAVATSVAEDLPGQVIAEEEVEEVGVLPTPAFNSPKSVPTTKARPTLMPVATAIVGAKPGESGSVVELKPFMGKGKALSGVAGREGRVFSSAFTKETAKGCSNHPEFLQGPMFLVKTSKDCEITTQMSLTGPGAAGVPFSTYVFNQTESSSTAAGNASKDVPFIPGDDIQGLHLNRETMSFADHSSDIQQWEAVGGKEYIVMPATFHPGSLVEYGLTISATEGSGLCCLQIKDPAMNAEVSGVWDQGSAGGCPNHLTWVNNPMFALSVIPTTAVAEGVHKTTRVTLVLKTKYTNSGAPPASSIRVVEPEKAGVANAVVSSTPLVASSSFFPGFRAVLSLDVSTSDPQPLIVYPSTFDPGHTGSFTISAYCHDKETTCRLASVAPPAPPISHTVSWIPGLDRSYKVRDGNPLLLVKTEKAQEVTVVLKVDASGPQIGMGLTVLKAPLNFVPPHRVSSLEVLHQGQFILSHAVRETFVLNHRDSPGGFAFIPATFEAGVHGECTVEIFGADQAAISVTKIR